MAEKMTFNVTGTTEKMKANLKSNQHTIIIDEPPNMGGSDEGPDPISNMLASLAGCENVIANMVAKEMKFDLESIEFDIRGELDPRGLMGNASVRPFFEKVQVDAKVSTSESQDRIDELKEKTDARCPVFTTLKAAGVELEANWVKA
ncbi:OsmC family protein [Salipaludibacillus daqingensis]|uniref:OsmC family protein n=1 Tax=Salipaludibacillus daqingensis TaxID=3041001 RepID=UPI002475D621|nr:OsmC family protein [Salipaludibacillus daqingensis]